MVFSPPTLLTGVQASAAQNAPVTKTCLQCGAVLPSSVRACSFCDSSFPADIHGSEDPRTVLSQGNLALRAEGDVADGAAALNCRTGSEKSQVNTGWQGELAERVHAYRARRRKLAPNTSQSKLPFEDATEKPIPNASIAVEQSQPPNKDDFSFT